jgi:hypothetical protein
MAQPFETELEELAAKFARELKDEVTALILRRLGIEKSASRPAATSARPVQSKPSRALAAPKRAAAAASASKGRIAKAPPTKPSRRTRATPEERAQSLTSVERVVAGSDGLSAGEIERKSGLPGPVVASALKALKSEKRIFMGGTKRFARYATSQSAADKASRDARGGKAAA